MDERRRIRISKFVSRHLRHAPEAVGLTLEPGGYVRGEELLAGCQRAGFALGWAELREVVERCGKGRFAFDESGERIRANQGHSTPVDLELTAQTPPDVLYHGTATKYLEAIRADGLKPMKRHHVHLSEDEATARQVGGRHGTPTILRIDAAAMVREGAIFYRSQNGVWLIEEVAARYVTEA